MGFQHQWQDGQVIELQTGKIVCAGLNYALHVQEMNSTPAEDEPVLFIKPGTALQSLHQPLIIPQTRGAVHHELEIAVLISRKLQDCNESEARGAVSGIALALDLTLRDLQSTLKKTGRPWEKSKAFDGSCAISHFVPVSQCPPLNRIDIGLAVNEQARQTGNSSDMLFPIPRLLCEISRYFTLEPGDIVLTGTPQGVGPLVSGDRLSMRLANVLSLETTVA